MTTHNKKILVSQRPTNGPTGEDYLIPPPPPAGLIEGGHPSNEGPGQNEEMELVSSNDTQSPEEEPKDIPEDLLTSKLTNNTSHFTTPSHSTPTAGTAATATKRRWEDITTTTSQPPLKKAQNSPANLSTLPPEILRNIFSFFCQCCRNEMCKYDLNPQLASGHQVYLLPGMKSDTRTLSNICRSSRSLRNAAQEVLHHSPYIEGTSSIVKLCRTVVKRPDLGRAIRALPAWEFGGLEDVAARYEILPMVQLSQKNELPVTQELVHREQRAHVDALSGPMRLKSKPTASFLRAYAMNMIVKMAERVHCLYVIQPTRLLPGVVPPKLKPLTNLRECYLFLGRRRVWMYTHMAYNDILSALFQACPQLSVLGLQVDMACADQPRNQYTLTAADNKGKVDIPIQRLELRCPQYQTWHMAGPLLGFILPYFENASKLSELCWIPVDMHHEGPNQPVGAAFPGHIHTMDDLSWEMTTTSKNRLRHLAFLNPNLGYEDREVTETDDRIDRTELTPEDITGESLSFRQFPNLEVLDISAHFAYKSSALSTLPDSIKEVRIHDSVSCLANELAKDMLNLMFRRIETERAGGYHHPSPIIFANWYHVSRVQTAWRFQRQAHDPLGRLHFGDIPDGWLVARSNEELERDFRTLL